MGKEPFDGVAMHGNVFRVHVVSADVLALDGAECSRAHMQRQFLALDASGVNLLEDALCEVQACRRGCHRALYLGIDRLVSCLVALLRFAVEVGWDGELADSVDDFGEGEKPLPSPLQRRGSPVSVPPSFGGDGGGCPFKFNQLARAVRAFARCRNCQLSIINCQLSRQRPFFPLLQVPHEAIPRALAATGKVLLILGWLCRFQQEDFDESSRLLPEVQTCLDDSCIVEDHECSFGQKGWQGAELCLADAAPIIDEQFAAVALRQRELCDALIGQRVVVVAYLYVFCVHLMQKFVQR